MPRTRRATALIGVLALAACQRSDRMDGTAIVLVLDGVRLEDSLGDGISGATGAPAAELMPATWDALLPAGTRASQAWSLGPTTTTPAHAAIVSGRRQPLATASADDAAGLYRPQLPGLFDALRSGRGEGEDAVVLVANTGLVRPVERSLWPGAEGASWLWVVGEDGEPASDDRLVLAALQEHLDEVPTALAVVNLHQLDRAGHYGDDDDHIEGIERVDAPIAEQWGWLQDHRDYRDDTTLVIVADHGRHSDSDDEPPWRHHGDSCDGCRRLPALALGPGIEAGIDLDDPLLLTDLAPTLAAALDVPLPWADGLVRGDLIGSADGSRGRGGLADAAVADGLVAELRYQDDPARRSALWVAGVQLSDPDALQVEALALVSHGARAWACFRELRLDPSQDSTPWRARCAVSEDGGSSWEDLDSPVDRVGPLWRPALAVDDSGALLSAWVDNRAGTAEGGAVGETGELHLVVSRYDDGWSSAWLAPGLRFPTELDAAVLEQSMVVAVGAGPDEAGSQHERDIWTARATIGDGEPRWGRARAVGLRELLGVDGSWRFELPALRVDPDGGLQLAAVASSESGTQGVLAWSADGGRSWERAALVELEHPVAPHAAPVWMGDEAVWITVDAAADDSQLCASDGSASARCASVHSPRVLRLVPGDQPQALVDIDQGTWELEPVGL